MSAPVPSPSDLHLAAAVEALALADECLGLAIEASVDEDDARRGPPLPDLIAMRAACNLFRAVLAPATDVIRLPPMVGAFLRHAAQIVEHADYAPGLERAVFALDFVGGCLEEAMDAARAGDWRERCLGASHCLAAIMSEIEVTLTDRPARPSDGFFCPN